MKSKKKSRDPLNISVTPCNAHQILEKLAERLVESRSRSSSDSKCHLAAHFGVMCNGDYNPVLVAGFAFCRPSNILDNTSFDIVKLAAIRKQGTSIDENRSIGLWSLSNMYGRSPIMFKSPSAMSLEEFAFWMRKPLAEVESAFCQEVIWALMKHIEHDPVWRISNVFGEWVEIDPWKFVVEVDLESCSEQGA